MSPPRIMTQAEMAQVEAMGLMLAQEREKLREAKARADTAEMIRDATRTCIEKELGLPKFPRGVG